MKSLVFFLLLCLFSLVLSFSSSQTDLPKLCLDDQRSPLLQLQRDLYYAPNFTFSSKFELWGLDTDCCSWEGVTCNALGHVVWLDLSYKNLSGSFHSIFNLRHLRRLNLAGNNFNTTLLSYEFGKLPNLTHLNLSASCFHGQIPVEISFLTRLVSLDLSHQEFCFERYYYNLNPYPYYYSYSYYYYLYYNGPMPEEFQQPLKLEKPDLKTLMKNLRFLKELYLDSVNISTQSGKWLETKSPLLSNLHVLSLSNCGLEGSFCSSLSRLPFLSKLFLDINPISYLPPNFLEFSSHLVSLGLIQCNLSGPFPTEILLLPKIQSIDISFNFELMGHLPEFPSNSSLRSLSLSSTNFSGKLPESIGNLKFLTDLSLGHCNFFGPIPSSIANLSHLINLDLQGNNFSGPIPSSIANLSHLMKLDLTFNTFSGSIPPFHSFGVPNLAYLSLYNNKLSGSIDSSLFTLPSLRTLFIEGNQLVGEIDEFTNASSSLIEQLYLGSNHFTGPFPKSILQLPRLQDFSLGYNSFSSMKLDMFFQLKNLRSLSLSNTSLSLESDNKSLTFPQLESLYLSSCNLTEFPEFLKRQDKLTRLDLSNNHIHGVVPNWLWKSTLSFLDLSFNAIDFPKQFPLPDASFSFQSLRELRLRSCNISVFPEVLKSQEKLELLDLSNNMISGAIPNWLWKKGLRYLYLANNHLSSLDQISADQSLTSSQNSLPKPICNLSQLTIFNASHNNLSGQIPNCLSNMSALSLLDLQGNDFSGTLPNFSKLTQLRSLIVRENRLEGKLPRSLADCTQLVFLDVGNNNMRDTFPFWLEKLPALTVLVLRENRFYGQIATFPSLDVLDIASNDFSGELSIDFLQATQLRSLKIGGNKFEGKLPRSLSNCTTLEVLDVGNNMVHDTFPFWLEKLPSLKVIILRGNRFYGPVTAFDTRRGFPKLRILDISSNSFSGELSIQFLQCLKAMMQITDDEKAKREYIGDRYYQDSVTISNKGNEMLYEKVLTILTCLDLSNNSFHGRIPEEIQMLRPLKVLNLSNNGFSGEIPFALENLKELESLDLSFNRLSGKIPPQLTNLTSLSVLNMSYNQLEGSIPQGNQFNTFLNDSYRGNPKLCGTPLSRKCNEVDLPVPPPPAGEDEDSWLYALSTWEIALIGYASGLVAGLCIGFTVLNELGNKWVHNFKNYGKRNRRRRSR